MVQALATDPQSTHGLPEDVKRRYEGVREFLQTFDQVRGRPTWRQGDVPLPIVHLSGPAEATFVAVQVLEERCKEGPFALVTAVAAEDGPQFDNVQGHASYEPLAQQLREAADALASTASRGEAHLRFPLLNQVLWLLELALEPPDPKQSLKKYVKWEVLRRRSGVGLRERQGWTSFWANFRAYVEGPLPAWAAAATLFSVLWGNRLTTLLGVLAIAAGLAVGVLHVLLLSRSWAGLHRYRWFRRQPYLMRRRRGRSPDNFVEFALAVVELAAVTLSGQHRSDEDPATERKQRESRNASQEIERLLVNAFLEDLRQGYERRLWRLWRRVTWARTTYPVLVVDGRSTHLVRLIEDVRAEVCVADPLLVVVATDEQALVEPLTPPGDTDPAATGLDGAEALWRDWQASLVKDRTLGSRRQLQVEMDTQDGELLQKAKVPIARRRTPILARPAVPLLVLMALVGSSILYVVLATTGYCAPDVRRTTTEECVGISDGSFEFHPRFSATLATILQQNDEIARSRRPYATVLYVGALSLSATAMAGGDDLLADVHGELVGIALRQRRLVENGKDGTTLQMRVLVANAGGGYGYARDVAQDIVDKIKEDRTIVGVVGLGESRSTVRDALDRLRRLALPVITTAATLDDLGLFDGTHAPSLFPLAPPNSQLARNAARWAAAGIPEHNIPAAATAAVFVDVTAGDLYTSDLGRKFKQEFGPRATLVEYSGAANIDQEISQVCLSASRPNLLYYAGRSTQFGSFVGAIARSQCHEVTVVAGDAVTQYVNDHARELGGNHRIKLLYTPLASPASWDRVPAGSRRVLYDQGSDLLKDLGMNGRPSNEQPSMGYAALAADAVDALMSAAQLAYSAQHGATGPAELDRGGVLLALERLGPIDGYSGLVKLHGAKDRHHALDRPVLLVAVTPDGKQIVVRQCGRLYAEQQATAAC